MMCAGGQVREVIRLWYVWIGISPHFHSIMAARSVVHMGSKGVGRERVSAKTFWEECSKYV